MNVPFTVFINIISCNGKHVGVRILLGFGILRTTIVAFVCKAITYLRVEIVRCVIAQEATIAVIDCSSSLFYTTILHGQFRASVGKAHRVVGLIVVRPHAEEATQLTVFLHIILTIAYPKLRCIVEDDDILSSRRQFGLGAVIMDAIQLVKATIVSLDANGFPIAFIE